MPCISKTRAGELGRAWQVRVVCFIATLTDGIVDAVADVERSLPFALGRAGTVTGM